ncbi:MAG: hypothetical protein ACOC9C_02465 [Chloroflexota bacterium]
MDQTNNLSTKSDQTAELVSPVIEPVPDQAINQSSAFDPRQASIGVVRPPSDHLAVDLFLRATTENGMWREQEDTYMLRWLDDTTEEPDRSLPTLVPELQAKLRNEWQEALREAEELEATYPDPVAALVEFLGDLPGDPETWQRVIDEPYG